MPLLPEISEGLDLGDLDAMTPGEAEANLLYVWSWRGPMYEMGANSLMLDYASPRFAKAHRWGSDFYGRPDNVNIILLGIQNLASYMMLGWETGITNQFNLQRRNGLNKRQIMEVVMFTQLYAGMRGLGHIYRAVGDALPGMAEPTTPAPFPDGWAPDPAAFACGLDLSTRACTGADRRAITTWYEGTIGYLPESIEFGLEIHPEFVKMNRVKWESAIQKLPKQVAPHIMIRLNMMSGNAEGLREAVLLARAWDISRQHVINSINASVMYFTGFEGLHTAATAARQILRDWPADAGRS
jgi:hypothetical protein